MLEYEWGGNPPTIILSPGGDEQAATHEDDDNNNQTDPNRHFFHNNINPFTEHGGSHSHLINNIPQPSLSVHHPPTLFQGQYAPHQIHPYFGPYATNPLSTLQDHQTQNHNQNNYLVIPKTEEVFTTRIGLNLGGRTYFSSAEDELVNRLYRRSTRPPPPPMLDLPIPVGSRCQAEGCNADLTHAKHYHRRHKVCEFHSKASTVIAHGFTQRFCQQCSRFHPLSEFDNGKRSCRKRLADHNRRRRKSNQANQDSSRNKSPQIQSARDSPSRTLTRSPPDSGVNSSSSVTVALSPPRMSLDCFGQRPYQATLPVTMTTTASNSSASSSSLFY